MTEENSRKLEERHKHLRHTSYFECGDGWFDLIDVLYGQLPKGTKIAQVKEKYGTLSVYVDLPEDLGEQEWHEANAVIRMVEVMSARVCEDCGKPGRLRSKKRSWIRTLCDEHAQEAPDTTP